MKCLFLVALMGLSAIVMAKDVKDFNKVLIEGVSKDIRTDNDQALKSKESRTRGTASVQETIVPEKDIKEETKIDKNFRQIGSKNW